MSTARPRATTGVSPTRDEDFAGWYQQVVREAELASMSHVRGCMVIRPWGYGIWELMQRRLDDEIRRRGHENVYFPVLIPLSYLQKEADHVEGFAKEVAVVTHHRLEERDGQLVPAARFSEPLIVRPTSEAIIGETMAEWVQSYRDLPLLLNQWANVVRWELRPRIFLRTTEFLWQEGHTAHATAEEAQAEALDIHEMYRQFAEGWLAMPVIAGEKSPTERFPGALRSFSIEAMMQDGKALQAGTSHNLGQNFARVADILFVDADGERKHVHTTSWGVSTRLIGGLVMTHSDDDGAVIPPRVAPHQVVIVPILRGKDSDPQVVEYAARVAEATASGTGEQLRAHVDRREQRSSDKRWQWTRRGAPVVVEVGPRDIERGEVSWRRRDQHDQALRTPLEQFPAAVAAAVEDIRRALYERARTRMEERTRRDVSTVDEAREYFGQDEPGFVLAKWCGALECEVALKPQAVTIRCLPDGLPAEGDRCLICAGPASVDAVFAQAY